MSSLHVVLNIGLSAVSFPFPCFAAFVQALTLVPATLAISLNAGIEAVSDRGRDDTTEAKAAITGSLSSSRLRFVCVKSGTGAPDRAPSRLFSSAPLALCSPRGPGARGITSFVLSPLSPLRNSARVGPATGSTFGWHMIGTVLALSEIDTEKLLFYSTCFSFHSWDCPLLPERSSGLPFLW